MTLEYRTIPNSPLALPKRGTSTAYALRGTIPIHGFGIFLNGALHWLAAKDFYRPSTIVAFDPSDEKFFEVPTANFTLDDYDLRGCLCMLSIRRSGNGIDVWIMKEYGVAESWTIRNTCPYGITPVCSTSDDDIVLDAPRKEKLIMYNKKEKQWREMNVDGIIAKFVRTRAFLVSPMISKGNEGCDYIT
uniref:F-box family protein n=1 Tax=Solanum tuberosum TaxID=4113 RepID=M1C3D6_SOLTU